MKKTIALILLAAVMAAPTDARDKAPKNENVKNVILIIGDGMGLGASASLMVDRNFGQTCFDRAQYAAIVKTYSANNKATDSAAASTAIATGNKTNNGMLGMLPDGSEPASIAALAKEKGLSTGIIATSYVIDATPGGFYAHVKNRGDKKDIIEDLIAFKPDVILGGGRKYFTESKYTDVNLIDKAVSEGFNYVSTPEEFYSTSTTPVLGLLDEGGRVEATETDSDLLTQLSQHTWEILEKNKKGFFTMVEGSLIDYASHGNNPEELLWWMEEFDKLVNAAFDYADTHKGTLVLVTADHETGGVALVPGDRDYTKSESGINVKYATNGHTACPVVLYAYGASSWKFSGVYENTDIFNRIKKVLIDK
jgi:alkaline phosphatase